MEKKENLLSISEMAKLRKVTTETLRHYDRIDLFKPAYIDPDSGYRYYSISQYERLGTIKELRQIGMGLDEIKEYLDNRNLHKSQELLIKYHEKLVQEIQEKKALERVIAEKISFMEGIKDMPPEGKIFEADLAERFMMTIGEMEMDKQSVSFDLTHLEGHMNEIAPILASNRIGVYSDLRLDEMKNQWKDGERFRITPFILCDSRYKKSKHFKRLSSGHYVCAYYNGRWGTYAGIMRKIVEYMDENHLEQDGCFYQIYQIDITLTDNFDETLIELQIPVKKH